jgi:hypothetical protein
MIGQRGSPAVGRWDSCRGTIPSQLSQLPYKKPMDYPPPENMLFSLTRKVQLCAGVSPAEEPSVPYSWLSNL